MATTTHESEHRGGFGVVDPFARVLDAVATELGSVVDATTRLLDDDRFSRRLVEALAVQASVDELVARLVGEVDTRGLAGQTGASSTRAHLVAAYRMSHRGASEALALARGFDTRTEFTRRACATGTVSADQAVVISAAIQRLDPGIDGVRMDLAQADLVDHAQTLTHAQLSHLANHLVEVVDPDSADATLAEQLAAEEARALQQTVFRGRKGVDGIARFSGKIPNLQLDMLTTALEAIASPRRQPTEPPPPIQVCATDETVTTRLSYGQRMGRAFCELVEHLPTTALPQHGVGNASIVVTIDEQTLRSGVGKAALTTGTSLSAGETRRLACNAALLPLVLGADSAILDLGRTRRLFDRHQRLALAARDRGCIFPGCDRAPAWTEAHHIIAWEHGGPTDLDHGCLLCPFHHHLVHGGEWTVVMATDGTPDVIPPTRIDPARQPIRHQRFTPRRQ